MVPPQVQDYDNDTSSSPTCTTSTTTTTLGRRMPDDSQEQPQEEQEEVSSSSSVTTMKRGYSTLQLQGDARIQGASIHTNVLISKGLPARGIISSNPLRMEHFLTIMKNAHCVDNIKVHTDAWGVKVYTCTYNQMDVFIAIVPMGSTGAGMAIWELYAAKAQAILQLGVQSRRPQDSAATRRIQVCEAADNLVNLPHAAGDLQVTRQTLFEASPTLLELLSQTFSSNNDESLLPPQRVICHNVEDYHAYNWSACLPDGGHHIHGFVQGLQQEDPSCCFDMETATLYYRAKQFGLHAATVLLPNPTNTTNSASATNTTATATNTTATATATTKQQQQHEQDARLYRQLLDTLVAFTPQQLVVPNHNITTSTTTTPSLATSFRRHQSTNDLIGVQDPLLYAYPNHYDVETGNNLFVEEGEEEEINDDEPPTSTQTQDEDSSSALFF